LCGVILRSEAKEKSFAAKAESATAEEEVNELSKAATFNMALLTNNTNGSSVI